MTQTTQTTQTTSPSLSDTSLATPGVPLKSKGEVLSLYLFFLVSLTSIAATSYRLFNLF